MLPREDNTPPFSLNLLCFFWILILPLSFGYKLCYVVFPPTGLIPGPKSYFLDFPNVFVSTCGTSFYSQCLPPQSINLVFSSTAMHWLRDRPCDVTGALHHTMITVPKEKEKFRNQAAKDWETILLARAKELAAGKFSLYGFFASYLWQKWKRFPQFMFLLTSFTSLKMTLESI